MAMRPLLSMFPVARAGMVAERIGYSAQMRAADIEIEAVMREDGDRLTALIADLISIVTEVNLELGRQGDDPLQHCALHDGRSNPPVPRICPVCALIETRSHTCTRPRPRRRKR